MIKIKISDTISFLTYSPRPLCKNEFPFPVSFVSEDGNVQAERRAVQLVHRVLVFYFAVLLDLVKFTPDVSHCTMVTIRGLYKTVEKDTSNLQRTIFETKNMCVQVSLILLETTKEKKTTIFVILAETRRSL